MHFTRRAAALLLAALAPAATWAQAPEWPAAKPIVYVVPFTAGGSTDIVGRTLAQKLGESLKQSVVIDNRPGQAGGIGAAYVAKAAPDGYTLFGGTISTHAINASLYKNLSYDPVKDFEPVALVARLPNVLIVNSQLGVNSVQELVTLLKKDESKRAFASSGAGTSTHLAGEMFADLIGVKLTHVPYKGTPPAMTDVAAGLVPFMFDQLTAALPLVQSGKLKLLAVDHRPAHRAGARAADHDRVGHPRLRDVVVAGGVRAQGHAAADRAAPQRRDRQGAAAARREGKTLGPARDGHRGQHAGGAARSHGERDSALGGAGEEVRRHRGLTRQSGRPQSRSLSS